MSVAAPVLRTSVTTRDPDEAVEFQQGYGAFRSDPVEDERFEFTLSAAMTDTVGVSHMRHSARFHGRGEPPPTLIAMEALQGGEIRVSDGRVDAVGDLMLTPLWSEWSVGWEDVLMRITTLDLDQLARVGSEATGMSPAQVRFEQSNPLSPGLARYWSRLVEYVDRDVLAVDELMASPLVRSEVTRMLATGALAVFPNSTLDHRHGRGRDTGEPATVRRAVEFIDAHAQDDIDLTRIAEVARIGPRGLQAAFRRHRDQSPLEYLRQVRMEGAHRDLQAGDPTRGDSVTGIAARWGFTHPGRFSVEYRHLYGCAPSEALRR